MRALSRLPGACPSGWGSARLVLQPHFHIVGRLPPLRPQNTATSAAIRLRMAVAGMLLFAFPWVVGLATPTAISAATATAPPLHPDHRRCAPRRRRAQDWVRGCRRRRRPRCCCPPSTEGSPTWSACARLCARSPKRCSTGWWCHRSRGSRFPLHSGASTAWASSTLTAQLIMASEAG